MVVSSAASGWYQSQGLGTQLFDLMEQFAESGFNKSRTAASAVVTYQTAWLKAHYPAEFMAATLSSDMDDTDKVQLFVKDAQDNRLTVLGLSLIHLSRCRRPCALRSLSLRLAYHNSP